MAFLMKSVSVLHNNVFQNDTITAQATPPGYGGIAVVRISGPHVKAITLKMLGTKIAPRQAVLSPFYDSDGEIIDQGIALFFPQPHSFTGEDVLELQGHGGPIVVDLLLEHIVRLGARIARPGEFSERAFLNGKIDLTQAEAIADLIHASSTRAARLAMRSLQGEFSAGIHAIGDAITHLRTYVEAAIDFTDEEIDFLSDGNILLKLNAIRKQLVNLKNKAKQGSLLHEGITVVIAGKPNVGKSSLLNYLSEREAAIVTPVAGTTRDVLREQVFIGNLPIRLIDTAGLHHSHDLVEQEGIRRAYVEIEAADVILFVSDAADYLQTNVLENSQRVTPYRIIFIRNKIDLMMEKPSVIKKDGKLIVSLSVKTGEGVNLLRDSIQSYVGFENASEGMFLARRRHLDALEKTSFYLDKALEQLTNGYGELVAEDLRQAQLLLSSMTGQFTADDLLGKIFSSFCIGK
jgi:tRNA modification GTPase